jgi:hypothetical protein
MGFPICWRGYGYRPNCVNHKVGAHKSTRKMCVLHSVKLDGNFSNLGRVAFVVVFVVACDMEMENMLVENPPN